MATRNKRQTVWEILVEQGKTDSRARAEALVLAGLVRVNGRKVASASERYPPDAAFEVQDREGVGRGGLKLSHALDCFRISITGRICADVGASTGGFTEVLLERGAERVFSIDVGYGDLAWKLRRDPRVIAMERTNARLLNTLPEKVGFICVDVSFISLKLILPQALKWLCTDGPAEIVALIKPQFEAARERVPQGGVIVDSAVHGEVLADILSWSSNNGLAVEGLTASPILGGKGNKEFLVWLSPVPSKDYDWHQGIKEVLR